MALHRALRDYPTDDGKEYGKVATHQPMPTGFQPDVEPHRNQTGTGSLEPPRHRIDWKDANAGGSTDES